MRAGFQLHGRGRVIVDHRITLEHHTSTAYHGAVDEEAATVEEAGGVGEVLFEAVHEFAELLVEVQMRWLALTAGVEAQAEVLGDTVPFQGNNSRFQPVGFSPDEADARCFPLFPRRDCSWRG